jgi:hypothetical protein
MKHLLTFVIATLISNTSHAAIPILLPGNSESAQWAALRSSNYLGAGGSSSFFHPTAAWPARIAGNGSPSSSATFFKESGGGYFASSSVYDAGVAGTYSLVDASPLSGLQTILLQLDIGAALGVFPVLHWNGGQQSLAAHFSVTVPGSYMASGPDGPVASVNHAWQWDLRSIAEPIDRYQIVWGSLTNQHLTQFEIHVTAGNSFAQVIPEPSTALFAVCATALFLRRRNINQP